MSMMDGVPSHCPRCGEWGFDFRATAWRPSRPARPSRLFGLLPARPAEAARFLFGCRVCDYEAWISRAPEETKDG